MTLRFGALAMMAVLCGLVLVWAAFPPDIVLRIDPQVMSVRGGHAFSSPIVAPAYIPTAFIDGDDVAHPQRSRLQLYEQGQPLGPAHAVHQEIEQAGSGRFSHWLSSIIFSASDNTDPRTNGRVYQARALFAPPPALVMTAGALVALLAGLLLVRSLSRPTARKAAHASAVRVRTGAKRLASALPLLLLPGSALLLAGVIGWSLFPPQAEWRIAPDDVALRAGHAFAWTVPAPALHPFAAVRHDSNATSESRLDLYENGKRLGPPHAVHALIADIGAGLYSHWEDTVVFASSDNSDPRTNGRRYDARAPLVPAPWLVPLAGALVALALGLAWRRRLRNAAGPRWAHIAAGVPGAILAVTALAATAALFGVFRAERVVSAAALTPDVPQAVLEQGARVSRNGVYVLDFSRFYAPFLEVDCCARTEIRRDGVPVLHDSGFDPSAFDPRDILPHLRPRPDNRFFDLEDYLYFRLDTPPRWHEAIALTFPVKPRVELVLALWAAALALLLLRRRIARFLLRPSAGPVLTGVAATSAAAGAILLAVNVTGLFVPLRYAEIDHPSPDTLRRSYGPGDRTMTWEAARAQLAPTPAESRVTYAHRLTNVVAQSVLHYWYQRDRRRFRLQVPIWENYLLWLAGELRPEYRLYAFADPLKALERGAGMCDQVSSALTTLLRKHDFDARIVQLNGHTVVTAEVEPGVWHVLDADFNVVIPRSIAQIQADLEIVRTSYTAAFARIDPGNDKFSADLFASFYAPPTYIGEPGTNSAIGDDRARLEADAYWLKWRLPLGLLVLAGVIFAGLRLSARRNATIRAQLAES